jgi:succinoglycan biosynthesis transport protein ExoP
MADHNAPGSPGTPAGPPETAGPGPSGPRTYGGYGGYGSYGGYGYGYDSYGGYGEGGAGAEAHLMDYVRKVYRHRWLALTTFAVIVISAAVSTFSTTPIYEGRVQLQLDPETPNVMSFKDAMEPTFAYGYEEYYYQTQYTILKSRGLARRTLDAANLWDSPEFGGGTAQAKWSFSLSGAVRSAVRAVIGLFYSPSKPPARPDAAETARQSGIIDAFLGRLTVAPIRNSRLVDVRVVSSSPEMAASMANALAKVYIAQNLEYKFFATKEAANWLSEQLGTERKKLEESELALQRYREKGDAVSLEDRQNIVVQRLTDLNAAYTKARTDRFEKEALYNQLSSLQNDRKALDSFPAILSNSFIQQLKSQLADLQRQHAQMADRLGEKHPDMIKQNVAIQSTEAKLDGEIAKVVQSVKNEFLSAQAQERSLADALNAQKTDALSLNRTGIEYGVLRREAESNKQMYELLMQRAKETGISGELKASNIRIVDSAEIPRSPIQPNKPRDLSLGLLAGLLGGIGLALFMEYIDNRVKNPDEIKNVLGLSFLGLVPALRDKDLEGGRSPLLTEALPQSFAESFRTVRTNVLFSSAEPGSRSVLVTSTQPQEGKTIVAANLALALAQTGQRVLLVDGDMRKPRQHELFNTTQDPGLSSLLVGKAKANDAVRKASVSNLWVMPAGPNPPNPAELLGSQRFKDLLRTLGQHFDWILIDSPPVMAVTDASVIGHLTTGVLFVIGSEQVARNTVRSAVEQLQSSKSTILGAVLNRVNVRKNPYYYAHYYKHEYAGYYTAEKKA